MKEFLSVIKSASIFSGISEEETESILHCLEARKVIYQKGEYIFRMGDTVETIGLMLAGDGLIVQEDFWGNRNIMSHIGPGQLFAESFACSPGVALNVSVITESACTALFLNVKRILTTCPTACAYHGRVIRNLLSELAGKNLQFNEKLTHMGQRTTREKLLSYLSAEAQRQGSAEFDIPFSRQQLADYFCVERSGLSAELGKMREEGMLKFHKNHFVLEMDGRR